MLYFNCGIIIIIIDGSQSGEVRLYHYYYRPNFYLYALKYNIIIIIIILLWCGKINYYRLWSVLIILL